MKNEEIVSYLLIIETNKYAGDFERELCGYATGCFGDCHVGKDESKIFYKENPDVDISEHIGSVMDEYGASRPVEIWQVPGIKENNGYNAVAINFDTLPNLEQLLLIHRRVYNFPAYSASQRFGGKDLKIISVRLFKKIVKTSFQELNIDS